MGALKGLIIKDLLQLKDFKIPLIFWTSIFIILSIVFDFTNIIAILMSFAFGMVVVFAFTFDEMSRSEKYMVGLPFTRNELILSKYLLAFITTFVGAVIGDILNIIIQLVMTGNVENLVRSLSVALLGMFFMAIFNAIQIPCIIKNGAQESRLLIFTIGGTLTLIGVGIYKLAKIFNLILPMDKLEQIYNQYWFFIYVILIAFLYLLSYKISCKIYQKKDA